MKEGDLVSDALEVLIKNNALLIEQVRLTNEANQQLQQEISYLREQLAEMNRRMFGQSKESSPDLPNGQLSLFGSEPTPPIIEPDETVLIQEHQRKKKGNKADKLAELPAEVIEHTLSGKNRICDTCGSLMTDMGTVEVRAEVEFLQAKLRKLLHHQHSYVCKNCELQGQTSIKKAPVPKPLISNSLGSASVVTETILQKYQQKVPAYRQEKFWQTLGLDISRDNITNWHILAVQNALEPLYDLFRKELVKQPVLHADETSYRVIESLKAKTYYWMFCSGHLETHPIVLYHHAESRGNEVPKAFLEGFKGYLHCDGWGAYKLLPEVQLVFCGAHIRRKFYEALGNKKEPKKDSPAYIGLSYWDKLFKIEAQMKDLSPEKRLKQRQKKLRPVLEEFWRWLETTTVLPNSKFGKAVDYAAKHREGVERILEDGRLELSNNRAERMIKELVLGRKNWLFSASLEGAHSSGVLLSMMKTAELNHLDVRKYFLHLFEEIPNLPMINEQSLTRLLPWSEEVQTLCK